METRETNNTPDTDLRMKAELFDLWEHVHLHVAGVYDFDTLLSAAELKEQLTQIINLEAFGHS
jgi:hypothetical protein